MQVIYGFQSKHKAINFPKASTIFPKSLNFIALTSQRSYSSPFFGSSERVRYEVTAPVGEGKDIRCSLSALQTSSQTKTWELVVFYAIRAHQCTQKGKTSSISKVGSNDVTMCFLLTCLVCGSFCSSYPPENAPFSHRFNQPHQRFTPHSAEMENRSALRSVQRVPIAALTGIQQGFSPSMPFTRPTTKWFPLFRDH